MKKSNNNNTKIYGAYKVSEYTHGKDGYRVDDDNNISKAITREK